MILTADHEAGLETEIVSEGRPQAVRTAHRIARANRRSNTANIDAALGTVEKRGSGELALGTPHADRETREAHERPGRTGRSPENVSAERCANRLFDLTSKEKKATMKQPTYKMERIALSDCKPHADAEAYSASSEDRAALSNSINESGLLSPIAVIPGEDGGMATEGHPARDKDSKRTTARKTWYVIDGIGRLNALMAAGVKETDAQVFDLGDLSVAEFVVCKNAMMRKVTTGTRVMAYLKCHEREVLAAADPEKYGSRKASKWRNKVAAQSHDRAADDKGWNAREIAERIGVSDKDVLAGIELLKATAESSEELRGKSEECGGKPHYEQMDLFETAEAVLRGETPIRRWKAAAGGKVSKVGGKAAADYAGIGARTMVSLMGLWQNWKTVKMDDRALILEKFSMALGYLPEDFKTTLEEFLGDMLRVNIAKKSISRRR